VAAGLVLAGIFFVRGQLADLKVNVPEYQRPAEVVWLQQNWSDAQRSRFHYTPQGTRLVPYEWFKALEQPCFSPFGCGMFADPGYLDRFGFVPGKADPELNPDGLPVGFAIDKDFVDPGTGKGYAVVGLTCAACHTNELFYDRYTVRIDGAPAMIEVTEFQKALGLAMAFNTTFPLSLGRYGRFERRVLGPDATAEQKAALKAEFEAFMAPGLQEKKDTTDLHVYDNLAGFARTDALTRIGNQVFAVDARIKANYAVANAPVRFPPIWDASWFDWVQYNSSIADPLVRNIGEALGVRAALKLYGAEASRFENSVNVQGLKTVEDLLSGPAQFQGLSSPKWPSVFPALDQQKVSRGAELYKQHCQRCHLPPVRDLLADLKGYGDEKRPPRYWWKNSLGNWYLKVTTVPIDDIGTDPHEARDFKDRKAETGDLKMGTKTASEGLALVTGAIRTNFFDRKNFLPDQRALWAGGRDGKDAGVRDDLIYKARPLDGIWAAAPYLHNGSVPNLYLLLSPKSDRPSEFWLGSKRYDPGKVGYDTAQMRGGYLLDTSKPGNSNAGHEFKDGTPGKGVIGPLLPPDDRMAIIEYLKSL
jgi:mono/diheme cytochrome c family protein